jgi:uncharacterized protein involved in exopolysaccharide biosynthesis
MEKEEGVSLIDMINGIKEFIAEVKKKWLFVSLTIIITSGLGLFYALTSEPQYIAKNTVMLEGPKGGSASGALALASQFGLAGGSSAAVITEDKLIEIIKSETIIRTTLFKKATIDSTSDILANHFIDLFGYRKKWQKIEELKNFKFQNSENHLTVQENRVFKMFYGQIINDFLTIEKSKSGIVSIKTTTPSEEFSLYFNEYVVEAATSFYVDRITAKGRKSLDIVQKRVDSITSSLRDAESTLARWKDASNRMVKAQGMMEEMRLRRSVEIFNTLYLEGVKRLEVSKFTLLDETPFLQIIDRPSLPLGLAKGITTPFRATVTGFFLGCLLSGLIVFGRKKYLDLTQAPQKDH